MSFRCLFLSMLVCLTGNNRIDVDIAEKSGRKEAFVGKSDTTGLALESTTTTTQRSLFLSPSVRPFLAASFAETRPTNNWRTRGTTDELSRRE